MSNKEEKKLLETLTEVKGSPQQTMKWMRLLSSLMLSFSIATLITLVLIKMISSPENNKFTEKVPIKEVMRNTIKNGGELSTIKHIYNTRNIEHISNLNLFFY